jgi:hypothetical protein
MVVRFTQSFQRVGPVPPIGVVPTDLGNAQNRKTQIRRHTQQVVHMNTINLCDCASAKMIRTMTTEVTDEMDGQQADTSPQCREC